MATFNHSSYEQLKPLNKERQEDFIWMYQNISAAVCLNALKSHHGKDADFHYKNIEKELKKRAKADLAKKLKEEAKKAKATISKMPSENLMGLVA